MAGWNNLPTEIKEMVVQMVDDQHAVAVGLARGGSEEYDALLALSTMVRELHAVVGPLLWQVRDSGCQIRLQRTLSTM